MTLRSKGTALLSLLLLAAAPAAAAQQGEARAPAAIDSAAETLPDAGSEAATSVAEPPPAPPTPAEAAAPHLLRGAVLFREGNFAQALVEFRVAERLGAEGEATWYAAAALTQLGRAEEASVAFARAFAADPGGADLLLDYYRAVAAHDARLYLTAARLLDRVISRGGEKVAAEARQMRSRISALFAEPPAASTIDWYYDRGMAAFNRREAALARLYLEEARALAALRPDGYRMPEVTAALGKEPAR